MGKYNHENDFQDPSFFAEELPFKGKIMCKCSNSYILRRCEYQCTVDVIHSAGIWI